MLCQSAPINPRNAAGSEDTVSFRAWLLLWVAESSSDAERRAEPVSPFSETGEARQQSEPARRFRPRLSARPPQQRAANGSALRSQPTVEHALGLRDLKASRQSGSPQQDQAAPARKLAAASSIRGVRHRHSRASGGGGSRLSSPESRTGEVAKASTRSGRAGLTARPALALIRVYQRSISPSLGTACRFEPTCSHYAYEAIERHGLLRGAWLALKRLTNCRPLGGRGYDPVPK